MGRWTHTATYQGLPCKAVDWALSPGLQPNHGYVDIDLADLKAIKLEARGIQWRPPHTAGPMPSPIPPAVFHRNKPGGSVSTATEVKAPGSGLAALGDLVLTSYLDGKPVGGEPVRYHDVYVSPDGLEELPPTPAGRRQHDTGTVRVRLTDIRAFYDAYGGAFLGGINVRLDAGRGAKAADQYDRNTINGEKPWTMAETLRYLFALLPGSPIFGADLSDLDDLDPPVDLVGTGEPVKQVLAAVLERAGLQAALQPDGTYLAVRAASDRVPYGKVPARPRSYVNVEHVREERKSVAPTLAPRAVLVVGRRIIRRTLVGYVPVFKHPQNDLYYKLEDIGLVLKYPLDSVQREVFAGAKRFRDLTPKGSRRARKAGEMLRKLAYKAYAPAMAFTKRGVGVSEEELATLPGLPAREAPWRRAELEKLGGKARGTAAGGNSDWVLHPPVFLAATFAQGFFQNFEDAEEAFNVRQSQHREAIADARARLADKLKMAELAEAAITAPQDRLRENFLAARAAGLGFTKEALAAAKDVLVAAGNFATMGSLRSSAADDQTAQLAANSAQLAARHARDAAAIVGQLEDYEATMRAAEQHWDNVKSTFKAYGGIHAWTNVPHGLVDGGYTFDTRTGIVTFGEPVCQVAQSYLWQPEGARVACDGAVIGIWAYEDPAHTPSAYTTALYVADDSKGDAAAAQVPDVVCAGIGHASQITPKVEREPKMRLYVDEFGDPFNLTDVETAGKGRAQGALAQLKASEGYSYDLQYFQPAVLDSGVSLVSHSWDARGDGRATTFVAVNYRGAKGPGARLARATANSATDQVGGGEAAQQTAGGV